MKLSIVEEFLLIALHPVKGRFIISDLHINYGIIGALLMEMSLENKISIENDRLILGKYRRIDNSIISEIISIIEKSGKARKIKYWVSRLSRKARTYKWSLLDGLELKGLVRVEDKRFLGFIPYKKCYLIDDKLRNQLVKQKKACILFRKELSNRNIVVLGLIEACQIYKAFSSDKSELKIMKKELKLIIKENPIADSVDKTIKELQSAVMGAVVASTAAIGAAN